MNTPSSALKLAPIATLLLAATAWWVGCNQHPVEYSRGSGAVEHQRTLSGGGKAKMDILWVIDNSGSMCEEQEALRSNFRDFLDTLDEVPIDFNMGVTTTHFSAFTENVAKPGQLQSTPHPPTGFGDRCESKKRIKNQVNAAVECTKNPQKYQDLKNPTSSQIECALNQTKSACQKAGPGWTTDSVRSDLFPCDDADGDGTPCNSLQDFDAVYKDLPKVLQGSEYTTQSGALNVQDLKDDFACMSYVGTRGEAFEQGLKSAVKTVSPCNTGGTKNSPLKEKPEGCKWQPKNAPNHGFLRDGAQTAVIFITDENDCSRPKDATLSEMGYYNQCGEMSCYFLSQKQDPSPLYTTEELADQFKQNLATSKGLEEVTENDVIMASIHGSYIPYGEREGQKVPKPDKGCTTQETNQQKLRKAANVCQTELGSASAGTRYDDFLSEFERTFPEPGNDGQRKGWMCESGGFGTALTELARQIRPGEQGCIREQVIPCDQNSQCPDYRWGPKRDDKLCSQWGSNANRNFCRSAMQVRISYANTDAEKQQAVQALKNTGICYPKSIGSENLPRGCVVKRNQYEWTACPGAEASAVTLQWRSDGQITQPSRQLADFNLEIRYSEMSGGQSSGGGDNNNGGGGNNNGGGGNGGGQQQ